MLYVIRRGKHRPDGWLWRALCSFRFRTPQSARVRFRFTPSCWYPVQRGVNDQLNKLYGFSRGFHHTNSVRIVWRPGAELNTFEVFIYEYIDGQPPPPEEELRHLLTARAYLEYVHKLAPSRPYKGWGYLLWPHFEGPDQRGAPAEMAIYLEAQH